MKDIFLKIMTKLKEVPQLKFIDKDKGQLESYPAGSRPAVTFPCALIKVSVPQRKNLTPKIQLCTTTISVRVAFDYSGETSSVMNSTRLNNSLAWFDVVQAVTSILQGYGDNEMSGLECTGSIDEDRPDGLNVGRLTFRNSYQENF